MLKQVAALGTTIKDQKHPPSSRKNRPRPEKENFGENRGEILELSPLARFLASFHTTKYHQESRDQTFSFTLEAAGDTYTICLKGELDLQECSWNVSWVTNAELRDTDNKDGLPAKLQYFLSANGSKQNLKDRQIFSLTLHGLQDLRKAAFPGTGLQETLLYLLMQVIILSHLPPLKGYRTRQRQQFFRSANDDYQALQEQCSLYFPLSGIKTLTLTLNLLSAGER